MEESFSESKQRPKIVHWNESVHCTPIDSAAFYDQPFMIDVSFSRINCAVFGGNKCKNIRRFWKIFRHKQGLFAFKSTKKYSFEYNGYTSYI